MTTRTVILDNEAVQALMDAAHPKHRAALAPMQVIAQRKRKAISIEAVVPTTVRVEAGWDRAAPTAAIANRLRVSDAGLDGRDANRAAALRSRHSVSVADAHIGAVIARSASAGAVAVVTSDPGDIRAVADGHRVAIVVL